MTPYKDLPEEIRKKVDKANNLVTDARIIFEELYEQLRHSDSDTAAQFEEWGEAVGEVESQTDDYKGPNVLIATCSASDL